MNTAFVNKISLTSVLQWGSRYNKNKTKQKMGNKFTFNIFCLFYMLNTLYHQDRHHVIDIIFLLVTLNKRVCAQQIVVIECLLTRSFVLINFYIAISCVMW